MACCGFTWPSTARPAATTPLPISRGAEARPDKNERSEVNLVFELPRDRFARFGGTHKNRMPALHLRLPGPIFATEPNNWGRCGCPAAIAKFGMLPPLQGVRDPIRNVSSSKNSCGANSAPVARDRSWHGENRAARRGSREFGPPQRLRSMLEIFAHESTLTARARSAPEFRRALSSVTGNDLLCQTPPLPRN